MRYILICIALVFTALSAYGAFAYANHLEPGFNYLTITYPIIAITAACIPTIAEYCWAQQQRLKSILWWLSFPIIAYLIIATSFERIHTSTSRPDTHRVAVQSAIARATTRYNEQKQFTDKLKQKAASNDKLTPALTNAHEQLQKLEQQLIDLEKQNTVKPALVAPKLLIPAVIDLINVLAIWSIGLYRQRRTSHASQPETTKPPLVELTRSTIEECGPITFHNKRRSK